jgi:adenylate cyclase
VTTHAIFLCDSDGRLIALSGSSRYVVSGDDVRLDPAGAPAQVLAALGRPVLQTVDDSNPVVSDQFVTSGTTFLCTFRSLPNTQSWIVGMAVPRRAYLADLLKIRSNVVWGSFALAAAIAVLGGIVLHGVSRAHSIIVREAARMNDFVLEPSQNSSRLRDIDRVLSSLERAKTAMRSMGKYVPLDLVRRLYHRGEEPRLGGEATELTVLFTDIKGFTEFAEHAEAGTVATRLGAYLQVMVAVIQREKGTIDKFIGDSVMAFWNAPEPVPGHGALACRAALACREALAGLYASPEWGGVPGFETRFGLHHCIASVGHFGSPERFNYTAIGDGINLASRLESLNKHYGTSIIVSAALRAAAGPGFLIRHLDRVAVKGKTQSLDIYELIGESAAPAPAYLAIYEQALDAWFQRDFTRALALAEIHPSDAPSAFLAARCRLFIAAPPPADWDGVYVFETK